MTYNSAPELHTALHDMGINIIVHGVPHSPINYTARAFVRDALSRDREVTLTLSNGTGIHVTCDEHPGKVTIHPLN